MSIEPGIPGDQKLVGGNHWLTRKQRSVYQIASRVGAADQLDYDINIVDCVPAIASQEVIGGVIEVQLRMPHGNAAHLEQVRMLPQLLKHSQSHSTQTKQAQS